ncbi:MAG TPA: hypothetical protein VM243_15630 [Phycisphaerae bacterium]|nr:hypothetical protein [Phycisphaerae bacterium]
MLTRLVAVFGAWTAGSLTSEYARHGRPMVGGLLSDPLVMVDRTDLGEAPADEDEHEYLWSRVYRID